MTKQQQLHSNRMDRFNKADLQTFKEIPYVIGKKGEHSKTLSHCINVKNSKGEKVGEI